MLILLYFYLVQISIEANKNQSRVVLTDFYNSNSPVYVITPFYESYTINLLDAKDVLENTSFSNIVSSDPNTSAIASTFISETIQHLNKTFCPVDEWGPLYQPARFYLSVSTIDLLFYNLTDDKVAQVPQSIHVDLHDLDKTFEKIVCFSIFQLKSDNQFGIDCNVNSNPSILTFNIDYNEENLIITNFTFQNLYRYQYIDEVQQTFIEQCEFRKTIIVNIFDEVREVILQYLQYCPSQFNPTSQSDQFLLIYHEKKKIHDHEVTLELHAQLFKISDLNETCQIQKKDSLIEQIFSNSLTNGYNEKTWNLGFLLQSSPQICKCNVFAQEVDRNYTIQCTNTIIELYQPNQIRTVQNLNDEIVLITGTNVAVLIIYLERSYESQNYFAVSYKQIFEPGYYLVDFSITSQYIAVILTDSLIAQQMSPFYTKPNLYCSTEIGGEYKNILKIFYLNTEYKQVYYQANGLNSFQSFLQSLNQKDLGDFLLIYDFINFELKVITLFSKYMVVSYQLNSNINEVINNQQIPPSIISFDISGTYCGFNTTTQTTQVESKKFTRSLIICFIKLEDSSFQLVAQIHYLDPKNENSLLKTCPISQDIFVYDEIINSLDLFEGIMGPLLNFNYVPNYNMSRFYPFYQNHKAIISKGPFREKQELNSTVYNVLCAINKNLFITSNIFGVIEILLTYEDIKDNATLAVLNNRAIIYNQTCIINAKEYAKIEQQFPIQIQIEQCSEFIYRNLTSYLSQVDYYKQFEFFDIAVQYQNMMIVICQKEKKFIGHHNCQFLPNFENENDNISQIYIQQGPIKNDKISYFFTFLNTSNTYSLNFCELEIILPNKYTPQITTLGNTSCYAINSENQILSFRYTYVNQQALFVLFANASITVFTPGPINTTKNQKRYNFSSQLTNKTTLIHQCVNYSMIGFEITNFFESKFAQQYLIVWCQSNSSGLFAPYILQYIILNINEINFWRQLPHYDTILSEKNNSQVLISGLILYVPILKKSIYNNYFQYYHIYNLEDFTPRSLVEKIEIEKQKFESIIAFPINNLIDSALSGSSISLTLIITRKKFEIFYLNQKAEFIFHLQQQFIQSYNENPFVLVIAVFQPQKTLTLFRNYTLVYNFSSTQITFAYNPNEPFIVPIDQIYLSVQGGYYQYLLLVNQSFFNGPIASYQHQTNKSNATIIPSPYLQINKYLGDYMDEITLLGEPSQIIDVGDYMYSSLYNDSIPNISSYSDLILVLTNKYLVFYQKHSYPQSNKSCINTNYTQNSKNDQFGQCSIREIKTLQLNQSNDLLFCQMQLNRINQVLVLCQVKFFRKMHFQVFSNNNENIQEFNLFTYQYFQITNHITFTQNITTIRQFCFCYFNDLQPFFFNNTVYQMIKLGYQEVNTYFGIYQIVIDNLTNEIKFDEISSFPNQNNSEPYSYAEDFGLSIIQDSDTGIEFLLLIILQPQNILVQKIGLSSHFTELGQAQSLIFDQDEEFVRQEEAKFIQTINHNQPHIVNDSFKNQAIIVGNNKQVYEITFDIYSLKAQLSYTFYQYSLCHHNFLSRPQVELSNQNDSVFYLVTQCLSNQFEYQSIQVEMTYLLNQLNTNIVYTSLFIRNFSRNYSRPVEILEPFLVNPQELHLQKIQLYRSFDNTTNSSKSHLLITNSTYFLLDLILFADNGYFIYYPIVSAQSNGDQYFPLTISAFNSYSSCSAQFKVEWHLQDNEINSEAWFITILTLILLTILLIVISLIYGFCKKQKEQSEMNEIPLYSGDDKSEYGVELQKTGYNYQKLGDAFKSLKINLQPKQTESLHDDEYSD